MHPTAEQIQRMGWSLSVTYHTPEDMADASRQGAALPAVWAEAMRNGRLLWAAGDTEDGVLADLLAQVQRTERAGDDTRADYDLARAVGLDE